MLVLIVNGEFPILNYSFVVRFDEFIYHAVCFKVIDNVSKLSTNNARDFSLKFDVFDLHLFIYGDAILVTLYEMNVH